MGSSKAKSESRTTQTTTIRAGRDIGLTGENALEAMAIASGTSIALAEQGRLIGETLVRASAALAQGFTSQFDRALGVLTEAGERTEDNSLEQVTIALIAVGGAVGLIWLLFR